MEMRYGSRAYILHLSVPVGFLDGEGTPKLSLFPLSFRFSAISLVGMSSSYS